MSDTGRLSTKRKENIKEYIIIKEYKKTLVINTKKTLIFR